MVANEQGFKLKQRFTIGGINWTIIQTGKNWVKCITSECVEERAFDEGNANDFTVSSLCTYLNGEFLQRLVEAGAPESIFEYFYIDLTAEDGLKDYGSIYTRVGLITCNEYRALRGNIPPLPEHWWWTATPDSPAHNFVRYVGTDGTLGSGGAYYEYRGVRPVCVLRTDALRVHLGDYKQKVTWFFLPQLAQPLWS